MGEVGVTKTQAGFALALQISCNLLAKAWLFLLPILLRTKRHDK
jgi:hypothetical protein